MSRRSRGQAAPTLEELRSELKHERYRVEYHRTVRSTISILITVAAAAVLVSFLLLPVLRIYGHSMTPTLQDGEITLAARRSEFRTGETIAFYYNNKILVKRVIAGPGDWVDIDEDGTVYVNSVKLEEPYVSELSKGDCNIELPYQVPENRWFVMGDHRSVSIDSRNTAVGCVAEEQIVGKIVFRVWPFARFGYVNEKAEEE